MRPLHRFLAAISAVPVLAGALAACSSSGTAAGSPSTATGSAAASAAQFPLTLTASNGKVTLSARPTRIVSLSPTATEDLFAVGAGSQVVAVDKDSDYPSDVPKSSLDSLTPNAEAILKYQPDLVVAGIDLAIRRSAANR